MAGQVILLVTVVVQVAVVPQTLTLVHLAECTVARAAAVVAFCRAQAEQAAIVVALIVVPQRRVAKVDQVVQRVKTVLALTVKKMALVAAVAGVQQVVLRQVILRGLVARAVLHGLAQTGQAVLLHQGQFTVQHDL